MANNDDYYGGRVEKVRSSNRTATGQARRGAPGGISPSEERRLSSIGRQKAYTGMDDPRRPSPGIAPQVTNQFRDLIADPRTGQLREMAQGPYAGPVITPEQWMSQHPMQQLGNLFARALAWPAMMHPEYEYSDPYHAPIGASWR